MKRDVLATQVDACIQEAHGNVVEGIRAFHQSMDDSIAEGTTLRSVSLKNLFEALVDRDRDINIKDSVAVCESMYAAGMPTLVGKLLHPVFMASYTPMTTDVLTLVQEVPSTMSEETIGGLSAHDSPQLTGEGSPYQQSQPSEKSAKIKNHKFGITVDLTSEAVIEDKTGQIVTKATQIGLKGGTQIHGYIIQKVCDLACTITGEPTGRSLIINGSARDIYANDHSAWDGVANDNLAAGALADSTLSDARTGLATLVDEKGDPIVIMPRFLIVPEALWKTAQSLFTAAGVIGSANNDPNIWQGRYKVVSSSFIDAQTTTGWWLGDPTYQTRIQWYWKPKTDMLGGSTQAAFDRDVVAQYKFSYKAGVGSTDYRYVYKGNA
jgi:hypothetical protein